MSDTYYQERAKRRTRRLLIAVGMVVLVACITAGTIGLFYDGCTRSFDRAPQAVVQSYANAVRSGDGPAAQACWEHEAYYDLAAGCSEICLSRFYGASFDVQDITLGEPALTPEDRASLQANVSVACSGSGEIQAAEIVLDSVAGNPPWKHWAIVRSTFGGSAAEPWCK